MISHASVNSSLVLKDQVSSNGHPDLLQSLVPLDEKEKEEKEYNKEKEKKERTVNVQNASSCTDEAPEGQGSLSEGPFRAADVDDKQRSDARVSRLQRHSSPNTQYDDNISSLHFKHRRFMIYLCGGYKGKVDIDYLNNTYRLLGY